MPIEHIENNNREQLYKYSNLVKGYNYERQIWDMLDSLGIDYECNPIIFNQWLRETNRGYDIRLFTTVGRLTRVERLSLKIECKFTSKPIFHSWFLRDWLSRDTDIIVTNNKWNVPYEDRQILKERGIKLFQTHELYNYLIKLQRVTNSIFEYINLDSISDSKSRISLKVREKDFRIRLKPLSKLHNSLINLEDNMFKEVKAYENKNRRNK